MLRKLLFSVCAIILLLASIGFSSLGYAQLDTTDESAEIEEIGNVPSSWAEACISGIKSEPEINVDRLLSDYQEKITRADFAYLGVMLYKYYTGREIMTGERYFSDTTDEWVLKAKKAGIVNGYSNKKYKPNDYIRRDEIAVLFINILKAADVSFEDASSELFSDDSQIAGWAKEAVYIAKVNHIISGIGNDKFYPAGYATREQSLVMLYNAMTEIQRNLTRPLKLGIDRIALREIESSIQSGIRVDKVDYPFEADDAVLGQWVAIDLIDNPLLFNPEVPYRKHLILDSVVFHEGGTFEERTYYHYENDTYVLKTQYRSFPYFWTNGLVIQKDNPHDMTASRYFIASVNDEEYLFLEFKNGDYVYRDATPSFHVFKRK